MLTVIVKKSTMFTNYLFDMVISFMPEIAVFTKCRGERNSPSGLQYMTLACIDNAPKQLK